MMSSWLAKDRITDTVAKFQPGHGIEKLNLRFDITKLRSALEDAQKYVVDLGGGFGAISLTRRPGIPPSSETDLIGLYHLRPDDSYEEVARDEAVDEFAFTELYPQFVGTYFETLHQELTRRFSIGRMRIMLKEPLTCNSWHRDPEPRLHIPIITNPGSLFVINHHVTHLPADGSVYFTDTRAYHMAMNGGEHSRVHIVAALPVKD
ncbi:MAG: aspartyl/asparaginyl beta-hydroxylase domain-containing protein [SAR324 cluster bacterium]|nr:aspartyl/asparaginyl beta-hydroxylase domain-containing protein [SAR324 cluster bacterium]MBL7035315.1 aspartyl/asparaginyl beta-hydroxylase domain-containing protein [SAR324 cluster bacterium]